MSDKANHLKSVVARLLEKGLLAADESEDSANKRLAQISRGLGQTRYNRWLYRMLELSTPKLNEYYSGIILFKETFEEPVLNGDPVPKFLNERGIVPVIKIDEGMASIAGGKVIRVLDGPIRKIAWYAGNGAGATKFRWAFGPRPSGFVIQLNAALMAAAAQICVEAGVVPIIEPELDRAANGGTHDISVTEESSRAVLAAVRDAVRALNVPPSLCIIKTNMIEAGAQAAQPDVDEVAERTLSVITELLGDFGGVLFLSGGMTTGLAMERLNRIEQKAGPQLRKKIASSFSRAALQPGLAAWGGDMSRWDAALRVLSHTGMANLAARRGELESGMLKFE